MMKWQSTFKRRVLESKLKQEAKAWGYSFEVSLCKINERSLIVYIFLRFDDLKIQIENEEKIQIQSLNSK